jgi:hypothetical protein
MGEPSPAKPADLATDLRAIRAAGVAGLVFSVLLTSALVLIRANPPTAVGDAGEVRIADAWFLALYLVPFAGIAFLWFMAVLRRRVGSREDQFFATVFLGSGLLFIAMLFAADAAVTAAVAAARIVGEGADDPAFIVGSTLAETLFYVFATKMAAVFMLVTSTIGRRTGVLPRWFVAIGIVAAVVMLLSVGFLEPLALIFPAWVAILSLILLRARPETWHVA